MKKFSVTAASLLLIIIASGQDKPRRFIKSSAICPIDYSSLSTLGLTNESQPTINIITSGAQDLVANGAIPSGASITADKKSFQTTDTTFKYAVLSSNGLAFDVIQAIGSFTLIKLWSYKNSLSNNPNQISEFAAYIVQKPGAPLVILRQISGIRKFTNAEIKNFKSDVNDGDNLVKNVSIDPTKDYYLIKTADLTTKSEEFDYKKGTWNIGALYLPVKLRPFAKKPGSFDFVSDFAIGTSVSLTFHQNVRSDWTTNLLLYAGVSSIKVDSAVANNPTDNTYKTSQNITAFSPAIGIYWEKKNLDIGFIAGIDFPAGKLQTTWIYRNKPWIGITVGVSLFKITDNTTQAQGKN